MGRRGLHPICHRGELALRELGHHHRQRPRAHEPDRPRRRPGRRARIPVPCSGVTAPGLGAAGHDLLTTCTLARIDAMPSRSLRTHRDPAASAVAGAESFDHLYDTADSFEEVYAAVVDALVAAADLHGEVLYG